MTFSIEEFKGAVSGGFAKPSKYKATIFFYKLMYFSAQRLSILCETAQLPSRTFRTESEFMYGVARKMPLHMTYDDFSLGFICTRDMPERYFFDKWTSFICNPTSNYMHYYDDYKSNIQIETFNDDGTTSYTMLIEEAYPISINMQPLGYGESDSYLKLTIDFAYKKWRNNREIAEGDSMNQGYQFQPHIQPVADSKVLSGEWKAPDTLTSQQDGSWNDLSKNPWGDIFSKDSVPEGTSVDLKNSADLSTGTLNETTNPIPNIQSFTDIKL